MSTTPVQPHFEGEKLADIEPVVRRFVDEAPTRRLFFAGRHLTAENLGDEQSAHITRLLGRVRSLTDGVVAGLEVSLDGQTLRIAPGRGLTAYGEDVVLRRPHTIAWDAVRVLENFDQSGGVTSEDWGWREDVEIDPDEDRPWGMSVEFGRKNGITPPRAGVLLLKPCKVADSRMPAILEKVGGAPQPVEFVGEPEDDAYRRERFIDAVAVCVFPLEGKWLATATGDAARSAQAWRIFEEELGEKPPWLEHGVAIAVVGIEPDFKALWLDRFSVVRGGGLPRPLLLTKKHGEPRLWTARIHQAMDQLAEAFRVPGAKAGDVAGRFAMLPPAGVLPFGGTALSGSSEAQDEIDRASELAERGAFALYESAGGFTAVQRFFPQEWAVDVAPVAMEQLGAVFAEAQSLAPFELTRTADRVRLLLPVSQRFFDPALLRREVVPQVLYDERARLRAVSLDRRQRLADLHAKHAALTFALEGVKLDVPALIGDATFPPAVPVVPPAVPELGYETVITGSTVRSSAFETFRTRVQTTFTGFWGNPDSEFADASLAGIRARQKLVIDSERAEVDRLGNAAATEPRGLVQFARFLAERINGAEQALDIHFLRARVEVRRLGGIIANHGLASKLALSPSLAPMMTAENGAFDITKVNTFASRLLSAQPAPSAAPSAAPADGAAPPAAALVANLGNENFAGARLLRDNFIENVAAINLHALRDLGLARLEAPAPQSATSAMDKERHALFDKLDEFDLSLGGTLITDFVETEPAAPVKGRLPFAMLLKQREIDLPGGEKDGDEAAHFAHGVKLGDMAIAALRAVEKRIGEYRTLLEACLATIETIRGSLARLGPRMLRVTRAVEEAEHDVAVAESIIAEEEAHVDRINARRREVLTKHVKHAVFVRVRATDTSAPLPAHPLDRALTQPPVITCMNDPALVVAPELDAMRAVFRAAPLKWFTGAREWLRRDGRVEPLRGLLGLPPMGRDFSVLRNRALSMPPSLRSVFLRSFAAMEALSFGGFQIRAAATFVELAEQALESLTPGDLLDRAPQRIAEAAGTELGAMIKVAACMHHAFGEADAELRLGWAERFSEFDGGFDFRRIEGLPGWPRLKPTLRQRLQAECTWLFSRVDLKNGDAVGLVNDLIRVALLLSAHAPVRRVVSGSLAEAVDAAPGRRVKLVVEDAAFAHVGMRAVVRTANAAVSCVVEDVGTGFAFARVLSAPREVVRIAAGATVQFFGGHTA